MRALLSKLTIFTSYAIISILLLISCGPIRSGSSSKKGSGLLTPCKAIPGYDNDGDCYPNGQENKAGTNPNDASDYPFNETPGNPEYLNNLPPELKSCSDMANPANDINNNKIADCLELGGLSTGPFSDSLSIGEQIGLSFANQTAELLKSIALLVAASRGGNVADIMDEVKNSKACVVPQAVVQCTTGTLVKKGDWFPGGKNHVATYNSVSGSSQLTFDKIKEDGFGYTRKTKSATELFTSKGVGALQVCLNGDSVQSSVLTLFPLDGDGGKNNGCRESYNLVVKDACKLSDGKMAIRKFQLKSKTNTKATTDNFSLNMPLVCPK